MNDNNIETTYCDCVNLIRKTVWDFIVKYNKHPSEFDDLMGQADEYFMIAYNTHDKTRSSFTAWLRVRVWYGLVMANGKEMKHTYNQTRPPRPSVHPDNIGLVDLLDSLNEDARNLILLVRSVPADLDKLFQKARRKPARKHVFHYLKDCGWSRSEILNAFSSLKRLLN